MKPLQGEVGFFVDRDATHCHRCGDCNYSERLVCLTCDPSGRTFWVGQTVVVRDLRRVR